MYGYNKKLNMGFEETIQKTKEELKKEGFGVLTEIDVKETLKKKLNVEFDKYVILGACNPQFALEALQSEHEIGLMLPCNIIVYEKEGKTFVSTILPTIAMNVVDNENLKKIATKVEEKLKKVVDKV